ncbi:unnamed protein product [Amoebophrya sp. A120]|nr:unnamed protein product [Amoebophrya sp. A120]|eukprot:GSA120T00017413001.1
MEGKHGKWAGRRAARQRIDWLIRNAATASVPSGKTAGAGPSHPERPAAKKKIGNEKTYKLPSKYPVLQDCEMKNRDPEEDSTSTMASGEDASRDAYHDSSTRRTRTTSDVGPVPRQTPTAPVVTRMVRPMTLREIEYFMLKLHRKDDGAFVLTDLCELDLANQVIEFEDVIEVYYKQVLFPPNEDTAKKGAGEAGAKGHKNHQEHPALAIWDAMTQQGPMSANDRFGSAPAWGLRKRLCTRGQGVWSLLGYALACERYGAVRTLLRAGASPCILRESVFEFDLLLKAGGSADTGDLPGHHLDGDGATNVSETNFIDRTQYVSYRLQRNNQHIGEDFDRGSWSDAVGAFVREHVHPGYAAYILSILFASLEEVVDGKTCDPANEEDVVHSTCSSHHVVEELSSNGSSARSTKSTAAEKEIIKGGATTSDLPSTSRLPAPRFVFRGYTCRCLFSEQCFWNTFCNADNAVALEFTCPKCGESLDILAENRWCLRDVERTSVVASSSPLADQSVVSVEESLARFATLPVDRSTSSSGRTNKSNSSCCPKNNGRVLLSLREVKLLDQGHTQRERMLRVGEALERNDLLRFQSLFELGIDLQQPVNEYGLSALELLAWQSGRWEQMMPRTNVRRIYCAEMPPAKRKQALLWSKDRRMWERLQDATAQHHGATLKMCMQHTEEDNATTGIDRKLSCRGDELLCTEFEHCLQSAQSIAWAQGGRQFCDNMQMLFPGLKDPLRQFLCRNISPGKIVPGDRPINADMCFLSRCFRVWRRRCDVPGGATKTPLPLPEFLAESHTAFYIDGAFSDTFLEFLRKEYFSDADHVDGVMQKSRSVKAEVKMPLDEEKNDRALAAQKCASVVPAEIRSHLHGLEDGNYKELGREQRPDVEQDGDTSNTTSKSKANKRKNGCRARTSTEPQRKYFADTHLRVRSALEYAILMSAEERRAAVSAPADEIESAKVFPQMRFLHYDAEEKAAAPHTDLSRSVRIENLSSPMEIEEAGLMQQWSSVQKFTSTHTFILYLNSLDEAASVVESEALVTAGGGTPGATRILQKVVPPCAPREVLAEVVPKFGRLLVFPHSCPHEGFPVGKQEKLLLRGEVLLQGYQKM